MCKERCSNCGRELTNYEIINFEDVCEKCMKTWEREKRMLSSDYYKMLL